jgi:type I restriction enzyme S subunit
MSTKGKSTARTEEKPALVPKLRFPEFRGAKGWQLYILEELEDLGWLELGRGEVISGQDIKATPGDHPIYSSSVKNNGLMGTYGRFMFDEELISWSVDGGGDFFHRPRHKFSVTNVSGYLRLHTSQLNYRFLAAELQSLHASLTFDYQFKAHPSVIRKLYRLAIPSIAEQQKIAECLSSVDELIAAQARKLDALKTHKKGLMQQLFPREGETQPRLRFPEFENAGEWKTGQLGDVCELYQPVTLSSSELSMTGEFLVYGANGVIGTHNEYNHEDSEIAVTCRGATCGEVTTTKPKSWITGNAMVVKPRTKELRKDFVFHYFKNHGLKTVVSGSAQPQITRTGFAPLVVFLPRPDEQQRIASCLNSLDALIAAETKNLEALKTHKKGLMQQLFPSPEEN